MIFSELYNDIADQFGDTSAAMITRIKRYINWGQQDVCSRLDESDFLYGETSFSTVVSQNTYTLSATAEKLITLYSGVNRQVLTHVSREEIDSMDPSKSIAGNPIYWTEAGREADTGAMIIELYPIPSDIITVSYSFRKASVDMTDDADISIIPAKYHKILYLAGVAQCFDYDQDPSSLSYWTQYENMLETMKVDLLSGSEQKGVRMGRLGNVANSVGNLRLPPNHFNN